MKSGNRAWSRRPGWRCSHIPVPTTATAPAPPRQWPARLRGVAVQVEDPGRDPAQLEGEREDGGGDGLADVGAEDAAWVSSGVSRVAQEWGGSPG